MEIDELSGWNTAALLN